MDRVDEPSRRAFSGGLGTERAAPRAVPVAAAETDLLRARRRGTLDATACWTSFDVIKTLIERHTINFWRS